ncbi:MAG: type II toxin-antitoxin system VapB family antitoxin [Candidatus Lindowbacteria bacterium]|nr:type II toxin-antitoxin system VapB family antitoxin [Candidatus Lindowbacteria bacterium]
MATNLAIDDKLIIEAKNLGKHKSKKEAVSTALKEYISRKRQLAIANLFGKVDFDKDYDYKKARHR